MSQKTATITTPVRVWVDLHLDVEASPNGDGFVVTRVHQMTIPTPGEVMAALEEDVSSVRYEFLRQCAEALDVEPPEGFGPEASGETVRKEKIAEAWPSPGQLTFAKEPEGMVIFPATGPAWLGDWTEAEPYRRNLLVPGGDVQAMVRTVRAERISTDPDLWHFEAGFEPEYYDGFMGRAGFCVDGRGSLEEAQVACEKAITAAWAASKS